MSVQYDGCHRAGTEQCTWSGTKIGNGRKVSLET